MARLPRLTIPGLPHVLVQRGNNRQAIFAVSEDYVFLLALLEENSQRYDVAVHAYVLLQDQFQVLLTPGSVEGLSSFMQAVGRRYVRYFNDRHGRSGTLWEGRYRSTVLQPERFLLPAMVAIEQEPIRAGLVPEARAYAWSSHGHWIGQRVDRWLSPHAVYWALGNTPFAREAAYAELVQAGISSSEHRHLMDAVLHGWALGDAEFVADLQTQTERRLHKVSAGRPAMVKKQD
ncbi:transposase [Variovorax sp. HJSM1_2]|uniref:transposase n=1 Tax=Variovorax sp. HJSM1_2 TaxID=3366263 RepID=UPI003BD662E0